MSRKRKNKQAAAVPDEVLAEGSGGTPVHVQSDEVGTALHVSADDVEAVEIVADEPEVSADDAIVAAPGDDGADAAERSADGMDDGIDDGTDELSADAEPSEIVDAAGAEDELAAEGELADDIAAVMPTSAASLNDHQLRHLVEALVFAADKPITVLRLRQLTRVADVRRLEQALAELAVDYQDRGVILQQVSGGYQFRTQTKFSAWVQQLIQGRPVRLSRAQLETLAIVAYRQPITRPEIDDIRGVDSSATLKLLMDRTLIRILGKREEVGRPMLYGTTKEFLDFFSLGDLRELPTLREYSELTDESRKVMKDRLGIAADGGNDPDGGSAPPASNEGGSAPPGDDGAGSGDEPASASADVAADDTSASASEHDAHAATGTVDASAVLEHVDAGFAAAAEPIAETVDAAEPDATPDSDASSAPEAITGEDSQDWPQGSMRMAAVTPPIIGLTPEAPDGDDPAVDAHVAAVLEETGVAATREPTQE